MFYSNTPEIIKCNDNHYAEPDLSWKDVVSWNEYQRDCLLTEINLPFSGDYWNGDYPDHVVEDAGVWRKDNPWYLRNVWLFMLEHYVIGRIHELSRGWLFAHRWDTNESPNMYLDQINIWCDRCGCNHNGEFK